MKWTIVTLVFLGMLAAFCASLLVGALRAGGRRGAADEVVLAKASLPAMSVVSSRHIESDKSPRDKLPEGYLTSPIQAIGRVLAVPVVAGQVLTESSFVTKGTEAQLAAALPYGMRAVSVSLSRQAISGGLLYPGCVVDVLASFRLPSSERARGQAISTTLLHGIQVLGVEGETVVSERGAAEKATQAGRSSGRNLTVTLMVDSRQAEALQLALRHGSVSLALRNPLDRYPVDLDATILSEGRLAKLGTTLTPAVLAAAYDRDRGLLDANDLARLIAADANDPNHPFALPSPAYSADSQMRMLDAVFQGSQSPPGWLVTVIRGSKVEEAEVDVTQEPAPAE